MQSSSPKAKRKQPLHNSVRSYQQIRQEVANPSATLYVDSAAWKQGNLDMARTNRFCWSTLIT